MATAQASTAPHLYLHTLTLPWKNVRVCGGGGDPSRIRLLQHMSQNYSLTRGRVSASQTERPSLNLAFNSSHTPETPIMGHGSYYVNKMAGRAS